MTTCWIIVSHYSIPSLLEEATNFFFLVVQNHQIIQMLQGLVRDSISEYWKIWIPMDSLNSFVLPTSSDLRKN